MADARISTNYSWLKYSDILVAIAIVMIVVMMVIPLPPSLLDVLISFNITFGVLALLMTFYIARPLDFSVFPSLLLVATLYRLALNVSTTRAILLHGYAGKVIIAFGNFVVGGNIVVGIIVFLILVIIQFIVITKGAERVAEVAARFTLDAMPGKQMSIDADLNAGLISDAEARARRMEIQREADFYGAMDGASKFVKGDAIAGIIITIVNIIGGLTIGVLQRGMSMSDAAHTYTILTVGDGLSAQIPALILSTATGIIVTRAASEHNLGRDLVRQLTSQPRPLFIASGMLLFLGAVPGLPTLPFWVLAAAVGGLAYSMRRAVRREKRITEAEVESRKEEKRKGPEDVSSLLRVEPMEIDIGYSLIPLVDPKQGGDMLERITMIRRQMAMEMGIIVPPIRIRDDMRLDPDEYVIKIKGADVGRMKLMVDHFLAMNPGLAKEEIEGIPTTEPAFGLPAIWITEDVKHRAESLGYTVVDPPSVMATHLTEIIKRYAADLLTRQDVKKLIDMVKEKYPAVVEEMSKVLEIGDVQKVLQNLLRESVPIKDMVTILETLTDYAKTTNDVVLLTEYVRAALARHITQMYQTDGVIRVITLSPDVEEAIASSVKTTETGFNIAMDPGLSAKIMEKLAAVIEDVATKGYQPVVLCSPRIRYYFKLFTRYSFPSLVVLSYNEISPEVKVESVGMVSLR